jgi:hypothetical protein
MMPMSHASPTHVTALCLAAIAALCGTGGSARADILVRFPAEGTPEEVAVISAAVREAQGAQVRSVVASTSAAQVPAPPVQALSALERAKRAYKGLEMEASKTALAEAESICVAAGSCAACRDLLFDAHLLAGAIAVTGGDEVAGAAEFVTAHAVHPTRVVDPRRFPPKIVNAFNRACADAEGRPGAVARVASEPAGAALWLDGAPVRPDTDLPVRAGRVYVEARLVGYGPRCEAVDVSADGGAQRTVRLSALADAALERELERFGSARELAVDAPAFAFLARLGIDRVLLLTLAAPPNRFAVRATSAATGQWFSLPPLAAAADAGSKAFSDALAAAVGAVRAPEVSPPPPEPEHPAAEKQGGLEDEDEDGDADQDLSAAPPVPGNPPSPAASVLKSPWLWISVGIVVAVVGGVVIGTQVGD